MAVNRSKNGRLPAKKVLHDEEFSTHLRRRPLERKKKGRAARTAAVAPVIAPAVTVSRVPPSTPVMANGVAGAAPGQSANPAPTITASPRGVGLGKVAATSGGTKQAKGVAKQAPRPAAPSVGGAWPSSLGNPRTRGMQNPSQWCYRRSVLQALFSTPQFFNILGGNQARCSSTNCVSCALRAAVRAYHGGASTLANDIRQLDRAITATGRNSDPRWNRTGHSQEDAHDFFAYLLGTLEAARCTTTAQVQSAFHVAHQASWTCQRCGKVNTSTDPPSWSISIPIYPKNHATIQSCLDTYHTERNLQIRCDQCRTNIDRNRTKSIRTLPEVLNLHLLRFAMNSRGETYKLKDPVAIPDELDIRRFTVRGQARTRYRLHGIVFHHGSLRFGHYIARAKDGNRVTEFDDSDTRPVPGMFSNLQGFTPYIVSYIRQP
ncbi:Ubiquitin carboxyl-terminal hydrolase-like protein 11 [Elsinoe fawcettii]|nr:Ubiquitin carboxyl-terminal hydrolase-like protein 11 [Elsinoe fawcettii]